MQCWTTGKDDTLFRLSFEHSKSLLYDIHKVIATYIQQVGQDT